MCLPMESSKNIKRSEAIWISNKKSVDDMNNNNTKMPKNSYDSGFGAFSYGSSLNSNSSTMSHSPFDYRRQSSYPEGHSDNNDQSVPYAGRRRTMTVSSDIYSFGEKPSTPSYQQSPFRRSNSISGGAEPNFGGIIKRSIGQLFNAATVNTSLATATIQKSVPKVKCVPSIQTARRNSHDRNEQITDHMVSYLCESAIR
ncbi:uncharacterized protein LOC113789543 [Dermatophagoides pteronyssinus]|uniref:Uncharacterized protein LOC113789543 n=1 Tax=Dermatophagoides pteronyssinus TaxID=6956 RepID=A0A6P6XN43_DERPT|nr:uncharacterized protein LOC113789543 [Dermatophagoides pteronyssinus]